MKLCLQKAMLHLLPSEAKAMNRRETTLRGGLLFGEGSRYPEY